MICDLSIDQPGLWILVDKSDYTLAVFSDGKPVVTPDGRTCVKIALGGEPTGTKTERGDERTPTGDRRVTHRNPNSRFTLSLGLNYPSATDAEKALAEGRIDATTAGRITAADRAGGQSLRGSALGDDIFIHGGGTTWPNWTDGCIALADDDVRWLYALAEPGTGVRVRE